MPSAMRCSLALCDCDYGSDYLALYDSVTMALCDSLWLCVTVRVLCSAQEAAERGGDQCHLPRGALWPRVPAQLPPDPPRRQGWQHTADGERHRQTRFVHSPLHASLDGS